MNKNAIQKYAVWARNELIAQIKQRAYQYEISEEGYGDSNASVIAGRVLTNGEKQQRRQFVELIKRIGYNQAIEEVAYTWFNRFLALRYMEVNDYLPTHIRVFSDSSGTFNPEILKDVLHLELSGLDKAKVSELINANATDDLYRYLLLTQCNALNEALPEMFERMGSYTEMLLPNNILRQEGVLGRLVTDIPEEDWRNAVQIIGWMFQYYNTEPKQAVFDGLKKNVKITKEKIPAATQLFTPEWIVKYMVENSLGRLWLEGHADIDLKSKWKYYLDEAEQTPEVLEQLEKLRGEQKNIKLEDIRVIDPCMGSGHILVYAFDVLIQIYRSVGYADRDATKLILEKNLYGLDIDRRAYQLAYFSLMMKARQYNRRIFSEKIAPQIYHPVGYPEGEEYGSLVRVDKLEPMPEFEKYRITNGYSSYEEQLNAWNFQRLLAQKYDVVVANPPYMGGSGMNGSLAQFVKDYYLDGKSDLFAAFIEKCCELTKSAGHQAMIVPQSFFSLSGLRRMRENFSNKMHFVNSVFMGLGAFGNDFGTVAFSAKKCLDKDYLAVYCDLSVYRGSIEKEKAFDKAIYMLYSISMREYLKLPNCTFSFTISRALLRCFEHKPLSNMFISGGRNKTHNDEMYLRFHWEVTPDTERWTKYGKGGEYRKHYGNDWYVANWSDNAKEYYRKHGGLCNERFWGKEGITWSFVTSYKPSFRHKPPEMICSSVSPTIFRKDYNNSFYVIALLNSVVGNRVFEIISSTIGNNVGEILKFPLLLGKENTVDCLEERNIALSRNDWDSFETSWNFKRHPMV